MKELINHEILLLRATIRGITLAVQENIDRDFYQTGKMPLTHKLLVSRESQNGDNSKEH